MALEAFEQPIVLLAGGKFKGGDLEALRPLVQKKIRTVVLYGGSRQYFEQAWQDLVPVVWHETLREAVAYASGQACPGDVVLLAPATSSFDQFANYLRRGEAFKQAVKELVL